MKSVEEQITGQQCSEVFPQVLDLKSTWVYHEKWLAWSRGYGDKIFLSLSSVGHCECDLNQSGRKCATHAVFVSQLEIVKQKRENEQRPLIRCICFPSQQINTDAVISFFVTFCSGSRRLHLCCRPQGTEGQHSSRSFCW